MWRIVMQEHKKRRMRSHITIARMLYIPKKLRPATAHIDRIGDRVTVWIIPEPLGEPRKYVLLPLSVTDYSRLFADDKLASSKSIYLHWGLKDETTQTYGWYYTF